MMFALMLLACSRPTTFAECKDVSCKIDVAIRLWEKDRDALKAEVSALTDPVEQVAVVQAVAEAYAGQTSALCEVLPDGPGRERCERINIRPHLASNPDGSSTEKPDVVTEEDVARSRYKTEAERAQASVAGAANSAVDLSATVQRGPGMTVLLPANMAAFATSPWDNAAVQPVDCEVGSVESSCRTDAASALAAEGRFQEAAGTCAGISSAQWRWECFFDAAETAAEMRRSELVSGALRLCYGSGEFLANCFAHVIMGAAEGAPPASVGDARAWDGIKASASAIRIVLEERDPDLAARAEERLWAEALWHSYALVTKVSGDPLDHLPEAAVPHIRAAAAYRMVTLEGTKSDRDLLAWGAMLESALSRRLRTREIPQGKQRRADPVLNLWRDLYTGEEVFKQVLYQGQAKRALADDPASDGLVCILEGMGRQATRPASVYIDALTHEDRTVRWTAARLIQAFDNQGSYLQIVANNLDPLVRARARSPYFQEGRIMAGPPGGGMGLPMGTQPGVNPGGRPGTP